MPRKRVQRNLFKLGVRGRRGRIAPDERWKYLARAERSNDAGEDSFPLFTPIPDVDGTQGTLERGPLQRSNSPGSCSITGAETNTNSNPTRAFHDVLIPPENDDLSECMMSLIDDLAKATDPESLGRETMMNNSNPEATPQFADETQETTNANHRGIFVDDDRMEPYVALDDSIGMPNSGLSDSSGTESQCPGTTRQRDSVGFQTPELTELSPTIVSLMLRKWGKISRWSSLLAVLLTSGSVRLSVEQYEIVRSCINAILAKLPSKSETMPSYSTIRRSILPILRSCSFPTATEHTGVLDRTKSGAKASASSEGEGGEGRYVVVKPSTWTGMDVQCKFTWEMMKEGSVEWSKHDHDQFHSIEQTPIIQNSYQVLDVLHRFPVQSDDSSDCALLRLARSPNVHLSLYLRCSPRFPRSLLRSLRAYFDSSANILVVEPIRTVLVGSNKDASTSMEYRSTMRIASNGRLYRLDRVITALRKSKRHFWDKGDMCTLLRTPDGASFAMVLVHHYGRPGVVANRLELVCVPLIYFSGDGSRNEFGPFVALAGGDCMKEVVKKVRVAPQLREGVSLSSSNFSTARCHGRLSDGTKYFVDRILLYSDGFSQYGFKQGSAGGVYCLSLNQLPRCRKSRGRVRILTLTPPGISTAQGLRSIVPDLVEAGTRGFKTKNADGEEVVLFTEVVGFVCDYHEISHVLDVVGCNGRAPCHLCSFSRFAGHPSVASAYAYTCDVHSVNPCFARTRDRSDTLRSSSLSDNELILLGLNGRDVATKKDSPLLELYDKLERAHETGNIPVTDEGEPVIRRCFDPYRSIMVAPDHLLAGIAINEMSLCFKMLPNIRRRRQVDAMICSAMRSNGLLEESRVFNFGSNALYTMSISSTFCMLLVSPAVFQEILDAIDSWKELSEEDHGLFRCIVENLTLFSRLVSKTYWFPSRIADEPKAIAAFNHGNGITHLASLETMCMEYISSCNDICKKSEAARKELDKPNLHRLLELYKHSLPAMGHVHHFSELVFECAHQPLKRAMARSNYKDSQVQSVLHSIADDWKDRLAMTFLQHDRSGDNAEMIESLLNLLCGRNELMKSVVSQQEGVRETLTELLNNEIVRCAVRIPSQGMEYLKPRNQWRLFERIATPCVDLDTVRCYLACAGDDELSFFRVAKRLKVWSDGHTERKSIPQPFHTLHGGDVVQALTGEPDSPFIIPSKPNRLSQGDSTTYLHHFVVDSLFEAASHDLNSGSDGSYALVRPCEFGMDGLMCTSSGSEMQVMKLTDAVQRVAIVHACHNDPSLSCVTHNDSTVICEASVSGGHRFYCFGRAQGFPPRMA